MRNKIQEAYCEKEEINRRFKWATDNFEWEEQEKAREDYKKWEEKYTPEGEVFFKAVDEYWETVKNGNKGFNIESDIEDKPAFLDCLLKNGYTEFTVSCPFDGLRHACEFMEMGCKLVGTTMVKDSPDPWTMEQELKHAFIFRIC